jgi:phenylacetate-CoA ligase
MTPDGRMVGRLDHIFKGQAHIAEAQILQDHKEAIRVLVVPRIRYSKAAEQRLMQSIRDRLGEEIEVKIEIVNEIVREPNGKFRAVKSSVGNLHSAAA